MGLLAFLRHRMKSISREGLGDRETIMDTGSTAGPYTAQFEQSPSSAVDGFALEEKETVAVERDSTATRSEYYSERCEAMMQSRCKFDDDVALEIEFSKSHWSEVSRPEASGRSEDKEALYRDNVKVFQELARGDRRSFGIFSSYSLADGFELRLGQMIAKGGQAEIFEIVGCPSGLLKVFEGGTSLRDLRHQLPLQVRTREVDHCILGAVILEDGRCAFVMKRYWGDLRKLIDQAMQAKNASVGGIQHPPFPYKWIPYHRKCTVHPIDFMSGIAFHMRGLHEKGVFHRDLKASNILLSSPLFDLDLLYSSPSYHGPDLALSMVAVADFECSIGVKGTGFWRAPEILLANEKREAIMDEQWEKADVYSFGMTCFEITTGRIPFDGELANTKADRALVIEGKRPKLPSDLDGAVKDLITKCWDPNPILRPKFSEIVEMVEATKQCHFRLFDIKDELPPQYHLATVHEVEEYSIALFSAMGGWEIANLANGSVDGWSFGGHIRPEKRNDVGHKLARLHS